jgi:MORN repeat
MWSLPPPRVQLPVDPNTTPADSKLQSPLQPPRLSSPAGDTQQLGQGPTRPPQVTLRHVTYQTGEYYVGDWLQASPTLGYPHGWGKYYGNDKYYEGQWFQGVKHGLGTQTSRPSGETYDGTWRENQRQGYGIQTYVNGTNYEGGWNHDKECGWGTKTSPNMIYTGGFKDGEKYGYAVQSFVDGRKYEGGIKAGVSHGFGIGVFNGGERIIEGSWKDGKAHGFGIETVGTLRHEGNFSNGFWDGYGEQTYNNGAVRKGNWLKGKPVEEHKDVGQKVPVADQAGKSFQVI